MQKIIQRILEEKLKGVEYDAKTAPDITEDLVSEIRIRIKQETNMPRYKLGIKVILGELKGQGIRISSKCLWDVAFDNYASHYFTNEKIYAVGIVYGCYFE